MLYFQNWDNFVANIPKIKGCGCKKNYYIIKGGGAMITEVEGGGEDIPKFCLRNM